MILRDFAARPAARSSSIGGLPDGCAHLDEIGFDHLQRSVYPRQAVRERAMLSIMTLTICCKVLIHGVEEPFAAAASAVPASTALRRPRPKCGSAASASSCLARVREAKSESSKLAPAKSFPVLRSALLTCCSNQGLLRVQPDAPRPASRPWSRGPRPGQTPPPFRSAHCWRTIISAVAAGCQGCLGLAIKFCDIASIIFGRLEAEAPFRLAYVANSAKNAPGLSIAPTWPPFILDICARAVPAILSRPRASLSYSKRISLAVASRIPRARC